MAGIDDLYVFSPNTKIRSSQINTNFELIKDEINTYSGTLDTHNTQINNLNTTVSGHTASINSLNTTVSGHTASINSLNTKVSQNTPVGIIVYFPLNCAPTGYLICNGGAIPAECTALRTLIGDYTPNLIGRYVKGGTSIGTTTDAYTEYVSWVDNHNHSSGSSGVWTASSSAGAHNHTYTAGEPSIQELPCIKY